MRDHDLAEQLRRGLVRIGGLGIGEVEYPVDDGLDAVPVDKISPNAKALLAAIKPQISGVLGQMGQNIHFIVYPGRNDTGRLLDPLRAGAFQISLYDQVFHWRLPLASLLPKKIDPQTHEEFPGNFDFNPYTGGKLSAK